MTIARRRASPLGTVAIPAFPEPLPLPRPAGAVASLRDIPAPEAVVPVGRLRRCTFRRLDRVAALPGRLPLPTYEAMCLYGGGDLAMALGDVEAARPVCEACTATGIFRPDEA